MYSTQPNGVDSQTINPAALASPGMFMLISCIYSCLVLFPLKRKKKETAFRFRLFVARKTSIAPLALLSFGSCELPRFHYFACGPSFLDPIFPYTVYPFAHLPICPVELPSCPPSLLKLTILLASEPALFCRFTFFSLLCSNVWPHLTIE